MSDQETRKDLLYVGDKDPFLLSSREKPSFSKVDRSSVIALDRVRGFLPLIEKSNKEIDDTIQQNPQSLDIEHIDDEDKPHIELSLALGVQDKPFSDDEEDEDDKNILNDKEISKKESLITEIDSQNKKN